jgi:hypothetical protein
MPATQCLRRRYPRSGRSHLSLRVHASACLRRRYPLKRAILGVVGVILGVVGVILGVVGVILGVDAPQASPTRHECQAIMPTREAGQPRLVGVVTGIMSLLGVRYLVNTLNELDINLNLLSESLEGFVL